jgi:serine/threonine-protein kinase
VDGPPEDVEVRILDFGLAKQQVPTPGQPAVVTSLGFPMGTPAYMSPEQCRGTGAIDARADIYAVGVVLYELLTGRVPFESEAALEVMTMQVGEPVPLPSTLTGVPPALEQVVMRALAKAPEERYESAAQMLVAFESACQATPDWRPGSRATQLSPRAATARDTGSPVWATTAPADRPRRSLWWLLAVAAGVGVGFVALKAREARPPVVAPINAPPPPPIVEPPPPPPRPTSATVRVSLEPAGRVFLDNQLVGTGSEVAIRDVPFGSHVLRTEAAGYLPAQRTLTVNEPLAVAIVLKPRPARKASPKHPRPGRQEADVEAPINPYQR